MHTEPCDIASLKHEICSNLEQSKHIARRVFHGRGKCFAGFEQLNIEWYPPYLFVQNFEPALTTLLESLLRDTFDRYDFIKAILVQSREWPEFKTQVLASRTQDGDATLPAVSASDLPLEAWVPLDDDIQCAISLGKNRNTGAFLDMRAGWHWLRQNSTNKRVLNLFSYTGVFSLFALAGGASQVDNVDMAANVLKIAQRNHQKNKLHDGKTAFYKRNILKSDRWFENREPYGLIIIDPPPYQKKAFHGWKDYKKLLQFCHSSLAPDGIMFACLNNPQASISEFKTDLEQTFPTLKRIEHISTADEIKEQDPQKGLKTLALYF